MRALSTYILACLSIHLTSGQSTEWVECIDDFEDYQQSKWSSLPSTILYEETSHDSNFPEPVQGQLDGKGIFYFDGSNEDSYLRFEPSKNYTDTPTFLYIKYYGYYNSNPYTQAQYYPAKNNTGYDYLLGSNSNSEFQWREEMLELYPYFTQSVGIKVGVFPLKIGHYFFVDKLIVSQGRNFTNIEQLSALCPTKVDFPTTTEPSSQEDCSVAGFFPYGDDPARFHVCLFDAFGLMANLIFNCPAPQIWCHVKQQCDIERLCFI